MKYRTLGLASLVLSGMAMTYAAAPPAGEGPAVTWSDAQSGIVLPSQNVNKSGWESYKSMQSRPSVDQKLEDPVLKGAIDLHAHFGPDSYKRGWDAFEIARLAQGRGMRGAVFKNHWTESAGLAYLIRKHAAPGFEAFGGLALNTPVGGINPEAVRYFAEVEGGFGKVVWMPTHDSENEVTYLRQARPYVRVSRDGVLIPEVLQVLDLIAQYRLTLATGHVTSREMLMIVAEAKKRGVERIIITHPNLGPQYTNPTLDEMKQVVAAGAYSEVVCTELAGRDAESFMTMIRTLGPAHVVISSDSGLAGSANHPDALVGAANRLRRAGFSEADLDLMFKANPAAVLGLPPP